MDYKEYKLMFTKVLSEDESGIYIAELSDLGFDSFQEIGRDILAYIAVGELRANENDIAIYIESLPERGVVVQQKEMEKKNWNSLWESNFEPILIDSRCAVIAPFHAKTGAETEVIIMPKMSFGTGHHQTTRLMIETILDTELKGKKCLDMGCGTAVLAILAALRGADTVDAIDIDEWAYENGIENSQTNGVSEQVHLFCGDASLLGADSYDFIFANINRNILLQDMSSYVSVLRDGGEIFFSGFLEEDVFSIVTKAESCGLEYLSRSEKDRWRMIRMKKRI